MPYFNVLATALAIGAALSVLTSCSQQDYIGDIVFSAPVTAVVYETGTDNGEPFSGIVYRKVNDFEKLLATEEVPVMVVFLDDAVYSSQAISFVETLADIYQGRLTMVRVNVDYSDNTDEVENLIQLFEVAEYPCFAIADQGVRIGFINGYTTDAEEEIRSMIDRTVG